MAEGIKIYSIKKNPCLHTGNKKTAFETTFGVSTPLGLHSTIIQKELWSTLKTAKHLFSAVIIEYDNSADENDEDDNHCFCPSDYVDFRLDYEEDGVPLPLPESIVELSRKCLLVVTKAC